MPTNRDQQKEITSRRIFDAALLEFASKGYELATLDEIAERSGVSKGLIIHRFGSKYELFIDILRTMGEKYLYGEKHYASVTELFVRLARRIKDMAQTGNPALEYLNVFSFAMNTLPLNCTDKAKEIFVQTEAYKLIKDAMDKGEMKQGDPFLVLEAFLRTSVGITKAYLASGMGYPSDEMYIKPYEELFVHPDQIKVVSGHFEKLDIAQALLSKKDIGLWAIEMVDGKEPRMFADVKMLEMLGTKNASLTPEKLYHAWFDRIDQNCIETVLNGFADIKDSKSFIEFQYAWIAPNGSVKNYNCGGIVDTSFKDGVRIEGTIQDISNMVNSQIKAQASDTYLDIVNALATTFEKIYYVNLSDNSYSLYENNDEAGNIEATKQGKDFFITTSKNLKDAVYHEDIYLVNIFGDKEKLLEQLRETPTVTVDCRSVHVGKTYHVRVTATMTKDCDHLIVGVKNVDSEVSQQTDSRRKIETILSSVTSTYDLLTYVELSDSNEKDKDDIYHISDELKTIIPNLEKEKRFSKKLDLIKNYLVAPKDRETFEKATRRPVIIDNLLDEDEYVVPFKALFGGDEYFYQLKFTTEKKGNEFIGLVAGVGSVDSEVNAKQRMSDLEEEHKKEQAFTKLFADTYYSAYYVNLETNSFTTYKRQNEYAEQYFELENFEEYFEDYVEEDVFEPDRNELLELFKIDFLTQKMTETNHYTTRIRAIAEGSIRWYKIEVIKAPGENAVVIGVMDIDDDIRREQQEQARLENLVKERTKTLEETNKQLLTTNRGIFEFIGDIVEGRDKESGEHVQRVKNFTNILAKEVKFQYPEYHLDDQKVDDMTIASTLHDVGKIVIPDTVLFKPGRLTPEEFEVMKTHSLAGAELLSKLKGIWPDNYLQMAVDIAKYHHEKWDGRGYPYGLKGDDIPIAAQIVSIADCFDALTSKRVYKDAFSCEKAFEMIVNGECGAFSERIIKCFTNVKEKFFECQVDPSKFDSQVKRDANSLVKKASAAEKEEVVDLENYISYKDLENILKELPTNIFFKDTKCRYVFCSQIWKQIKTDGNSTFSIKGKTDLEVRKDRENAKRAFNEDRKIVKTGRPSEYVIDVSNNSDDQQFLELVKRPVRNEKGKIIGIVGQINDVTNRVKMEKSLKRLAKTDELTGFGNRQSYENYIVETLPQVLYPVGVLMADCDRLKHVNDTFGHKAGDRFIKATASTLTAALPDNAEIFRIGGDEFIIIIPGSDMSDCQKYMDEIKAQSILVIQDTKVSVSVGAAVMEWPDEDFKKVAEAADEAMYVEKNIKHAEQAKLEKKKKKVTK